MAVLIHRTGQRADADNIVVDLHHLGDGPHGALAENRPGTLSYKRRIPGLIEERPRQA
jgi:hypothetical protein